MSICFFNHLVNYIVAANVPNDIEHDQNNVIFIDGTQDVALSHADLLESRVLM